MASLGIPSRQTYCTPIFPCGWSHEVGQHGHAPSIRHAQRGSSDFSLAAGGVTGGIRTGVGFTICSLDPFTFFIRLLNSRAGMASTLAYRQTQQWVASQALSLKFNPVWLSAFVWFRLPRVSWPRSITSSIAYSAFKKAMPHSTTTGVALLEMALWHNIFFSKKIKFRVLFYSPELVRQGVHTVGDMCDSDGGLDECLCSLVPGSFRLTYQEGIKDLVERLVARERDRLLNGTSQRMDVLQGVQKQGTLFRDRTTDKGGMRGVAPPKCCPKLTFLYTVQFVA